MARPTGMERFVAAVTPGVQSVASAAEKLMDQRRQDALMGEQRAREDALWKRSTEREDEQYARKRGDRLQEKADIWMRDQILQPTLAAGYASPEEVEQLAQSAINEGKARPEDMPALRKFAAIAVERRKMMQAQAERDYEMKRQKLEQGEDANTIRALAITNAGAMRPQEAEELETRLGLTPGAPSRPFFRFPSQFGGPFGGPSPDWPFKVLAGVQANAEQARQKTKQRLAAIDADAKQLLGATLDPNSLRYVLRPDAEEKDRQALQELQQTRDDAEREGLAEERQEMQRAVDFFGRLGVMPAEAGSPLVEARGAGVGPNASTTKAEEEAYRRSLGGR